MKILRWVISIFLILLLLLAGIFALGRDDWKILGSRANDGTSISSVEVEDTIESNTPTDVAPTLTLPILDEIDQIVTIDAPDSDILAVQAAVRLLEWGEYTGLDTDEISEAATTWLAAFGGSRLEDILHKLELVDEAYQQLLGSEARALLDSAGCENTEIIWSNTPVEPVEAIMSAAGLRRNIAE